MAADSDRLFLSCAPSSRFFLPAWVFSDSPKHEGVLAEGCPWGLPTEASGELWMPSGVLAVWAGGLDEGGGDPRGAS